MTVADDASKKRATDFLGTQTARGGTRLNPAITTAYKYADPDRPLNVIVISDGISDQAERAELTGLIRKRPEGTRVFAVGIGNDVNRAMLEQIANESGGLAAFLSREDNTQRQAQALRQKLMRPAATDVAVKINGVDAYDLMPAKLPNLYYGAPVRVYGRYRGSGDAKVTVTGNISGNPIEQAVDMGFPKTDDDNPQIERMWAMKKVDGLLKQADDSGSRSGVIDQIVELGEGYSIVTEYTSFLVLENDAEYKRWKIDRRNALRIDRDRVAQKKVTDELQQLRDAATDAIGPGAIEKIANTQVAQSTPTPNTPGVQAPARNDSPQSPRNRDFDLPRIGGGGAWEPLGVTLLVIGGVGAVALRRRNPKT
jgi:Ca-activated chloride channel family protein